MELAKRDSEIDGRGIFIHPDMRRAIEANERRQGTWADKEAKEDFVVLKGRKQFTGFRPTWDLYTGAKVQKFRAWEGGRRNTIADIPKNFDYRALGQSPVRGQLAGDCWAQGNVSAWEFTVSAVERASRVYAVQDVIDCSGEGTARGGGQLSMEYNLGGLAFEKDYPYQGRDTSCKSSVARQEKAVDVGYLRGADGGFPTLQEIQLAIMEYGAMEVCGSASSLGSGGRQDSVRTGAVNHCYALVGWLDGKDKGWLDETYLIIKNSWGDGSGSALANDRSWGDKGYGYYPLAKDDGIHLRGSVITEIQYAKYKPLLPLEPIEFSMEDANVALKIVIQPGAKYNKLQAEAAIVDALKALQD